MATKKAKTPTPPDPWAGPPGRVPAAARKALSPDFIRAVEDNQYPQVVIDKIVAHLTRTVSHARKPKDRAEVLDRAADLTSRHGRDFHLTLSKKDLDRILREAKLTADDLTSGVLTHAERAVREKMIEGFRQTNRDVAAPMYCVLVGHPDLDPDINPDFVRQVHPAKRFSVYADYPHLEAR